MGDVPVIHIEADFLPIFLLLVGHDVDDRGGPLGAVDVLELLEQDLDGLAVGGVHGDEVNAFGILWWHVSRQSSHSLPMDGAYLDLRGSLAVVELVSHDCCGGWY